MSKKKVIAPDVSAPFKEKEPFQPNYTLTEEEEAKILQFRERLEAKELEEWEKEFCTKECLVRYLKARSWNLDKSEALLLGSLKWRKEYDINGLNPDSVKKEAETGKIYRHGFDKKGRPIIYMRDRLQNTKDYKNQVRFLVYNLEKAIQTMDISKGVESWVLIVDFKGHSLSNAPPMSVSKECLEIFMSQYPERLGKAFLVDAPMLFTMAWKVISPLIPPETKEKVCFASGKNKREQMLQFIDADVLETPFGGDVECEYDFDLYWKHEEEQANDCPLRNQNSFISLKFWE